METDPHYTKAQIDEKISSFQSNPKLYNEELHNLFYSKICHHYMEENIHDIRHHLDDVTLSSDHDAYRAYSAIFGAFLGDSMGSFCEFKEYDLFNYKWCFGEKNVFDCPPGICDDG